MKTSILILSCLALMVGCESSRHAQIVPKGQQSVKDQQAQQLAALANELNTQSDVTYPDPGFVTYEHNKQLSNYAGQIALELTDSMTGVSPRAVAITSFVSFDRSLRRSNQLGNQLAESMIHQFQKMGYPALDFKSHRGIAVTVNGDFVLSRDAKRLPKSPSPSHVLTGTMIYRDRGVEVNTRLLDFDNRLVVASSNVTIPYFILHPSATVTYK
ncbi:FlgO family outer membrane protein [Pseudoalteromonas umbrosa]|uniref:FlgO family outer membrane protein n=1 Tax=Pseudoalteromonas umbrosa TaxID=3048489 RepID=UPI0024C41443|nr:FlgO family outer membrane protein [Pseudoalteromonas sp. B95]MDK1287431.1 FlgO family outer membrane protein [Pseudoalteromonas sp. B95]